MSSDTDAKVAKKYIDQNFVVKLLDLFDSGKSPNVLFVHCYIF